MTILKTSATAALVGIGVAVVVPVVIPAITAAGRPIAKGAMKGFLAVSDYVEEFFSEVGERWSDLLAEVRSENGSRPTVTPVESARKSRSSAAT